MCPKSTLKKVIMVIGPTAVGKTSFSIRLAQEVNGEIISADSRLFYRGMDIGTAKPTLTERMNISHHMIDIAEPDQVWSLAMVQERILSIIAEIASRGRTPIVVGGTGQYIRSLTEGWNIPQLQPNLKLREALVALAEETGVQELYRKLSLIDPVAAEVIEPNNVRRTIRALEVMLTTGVKFSSIREKNPPSLDFWIIGLIRSREDLYKRVDQRIEDMFGQGFLDEVANLKKSGYDSSLSTMSAIGYREALKVLDGKMAVDEAKREMRRATRKFVRRQTNWFKPNDPMIHWYSMEKDPLEKAIRDFKADLFAGKDDDDN